MSKVDIIFLCFLLLCAWLGFNQGIVRMGMTLLGIVFSIMLLKWKWSETLVLFYSWNIQNPYLLLIFMLGIITLITVIFVWISGGIERIFKLIFINWINKLIGMFFALVTGILILSLLIIVSTNVPREKPLISKASLQGSTFAHIVFIIDRHTSLRNLVLLNFDQIKEHTKEGFNIPTKNP